MIAPAINSCQDSAALGLRALKSNGSSAHAQHVVGLALGLGANAGLRVTELAMPRLETSCEPLFGSVSKQVRYTSGAWSRSALARSKCLGQLAVQDLQCGAGCRQAVDLAPVDEEERWVGRHSQPARRREIRQLVEGPVSANR